MRRRIWRGLTGRWLVSEHPLTVVLSPAGRVTVVAHRYFHAPVLALLARRLGEIVEVRRGGYVLPASPSKRAAFRLLRRVFGDRGRVAAWTRTWSGPWLVQMSPTGDVLGPFANRDAAVRAEVRYLEETND